MNSGQFNRQAADLRSLAHRLIAVADDIDSINDDQDATASSLYRNENNATQEREVDYGLHASILYQCRRKRNRYFSSKIFSEPAWDILLDLFIQNSHNRPVSVTSACIAGEIPTTTGLRWIKILEVEGLIEREGNDSDARITWLRLTPKATELMKEFIRDGLRGLESVRKDIWPEREVATAHTKLG